MKALLYLCFFLSGAAGLLYESYWAQRFGLVLGLDIYSHAAVLTAFMGGLALGGHLAGRVGDRLTRPWTVYAVLEILIGVTGLCIPFVLHGIAIPLHWVYGVGGASTLTMTACRFVLAVLVLLPPTALMGATLPIITLAIRRRGDQLGAVVGRLYALNLGGAVVGVLLGGFVLGEVLGLRGINTTAVVLNFLAGGLALIAARGVSRRSVGGTEAPINGGPEGVSAPAVPVLSTSSKIHDSKVATPAGTVAPRDAVSASAPDGPSIAGRRGAAMVIAIGAGLTGAAGMMTQVGWTRVLALCMGSSTYAFSLIVAVFLIGLTLGASLAAFLARRWSDAAVPWVGACLIAALFSWVAMAPLGGSPRAVADILVGRAGGADTPLTKVYLMLGGYALAMLVLPTVALGATFPLACQAFSQRRGTGVARSTGVVYAVNTIGAMAGSALGGMVCVALFGIQGTLHVAAVLYVLAAGLGWWVARPAERRWFNGFCTGLATLTACAVFVLAVPWDPTMMISGPFLLRKGAPDGVLLFYREAPEGVVAVIRQKKADGRTNTALLVNGKPDASTSADMPTQILLGQLPLALHGQAKDVAVIGLGSGVTLRAVLTHPVSRVDMIEMSGAVIEAVHPPDGSPGAFDAVNHRALDDSRVNLIRADGRNFLELTDRRYDVIISEPSNPWMAGVSYLFTREHFELCRSRLREDGVLCQWLHSYRLPPREFIRVLQTIDDVFDQTTLWMSLTPHDHLIIATPNAGSIRDGLERVFSIPLARAQLASIGIETPADLLGSFMLDCRQLRGVDLGVGIGTFGLLEENTDNHNLLNYAAVRALWRGWTPQAGSYDVLDAHRALPWDWLGGAPANGRRADVDPALLWRIEDIQDSLKLLNLFQAKREAQYATAIASLGVDPGRYGGALGQPTLQQQADALAAVPADRADQLLDRSRQNLNRARKTDDPDVRHRAARSARLNALLARELRPDDPEPWSLLGEALTLMGRTQQAREVAQQAAAALNDTASVPVDPSPTAEQSP